ncbi:hypothetical protein [Nocardiopsis sp. NRRL B-16309]|uniref:hypothetical protein n=1 Tax=Nocardiopsis sp. NRRL B-16309 TaxID=1519494 RepID=UPI000A52F8F1|nr:hypothetical protein [Nocardiopsis sp. NRRL B-16309]
MYDGPAQQFPQPPAAPAPPTPRRGSTGRTVVITAAATLAAYAAVAGVVGAVTLTAEEGMAGPEPEFAELPADPCAAASRSQLGAVSARMPSASFADERSTCSWHAEFSDGSPGHLSITFRLPLDSDREPQVDESAAEAEFEERRSELVDGSDGDYWTVEVLESRELDIADESVVSHVVESDEESGSRAEVLVRVGSVLVEVSASEPWEVRTGRADLTGDEDVLVDIAERAATSLE